MYCCCYHYMSPYSQLLLSKHDAEHCKGNDYDSRIKCTVMVYNLFQSLFLHLLTNKFHSYDFESGIVKKFCFTPTYNALYQCNWYICVIFLLFLLHVARQTWFLGMEITVHFLPLFITLWNDVISMNIVLWMFLPPADDTVCNTTCAGNDRNVLMSESVNNFIWFLWTKCVIMWMNLL